MFYFIMDSSALVNSSLLRGTLVRIPALCLEVSESMLWSYLSVGFNSGHLVPQCPILFHMPSIVQTVILWRKDIKLKLVVLQYLAQEYTNPDDVITTTWVLSLRFLITFEHP